MKPTDTCSPIQSLERKRLDSWEAIYTEIPADVWKSKIAHRIFDFTVKNTEMIGICNLSAPCMMLTFENSFIRIKIVKKSFPFLHFIRRKCVVNFPPSYSKIWVGETFYLSLRSQCPFDALPRRSQSITDHRGKFLYCLYEWWRRNEEAIFSVSAWMKKCDFTCWSEPRP